MAFPRLLHRNVHLSQHRIHRAPLSHTSHFPRGVPLAISRLQFRPTSVRRRDSRTSLALSRGVLCLAAVHGRVILNRTEQSAAEIVSKKTPRQSSSNSSQSLTLHKAESHARVEFHVKFRTDYGQLMKIVGSAFEFGSWAIAKSPAMRWNEDDIWSVTIRLPVGNIYEYKYVVVDAHGASVVHWQKGNNCVLAIGMTDQALVVEDNWEGNPGARVSSKGKGMSTKEERLLDWAAEMKSQSTGSTELVLETKQKLEQAQEETRLARQESTRLKSELRMSSMTRQAAEQQVKDLQQDNRRLMTLLTEQQDVHRKVMQQALELLQQAEDGDETDGENRALSEDASEGDGSIDSDSEAENGTASSVADAKARKPRKKSNRRRQRRPRRSRTSTQDAAVSSHG